jgi:hypothetical protein
VEGETYGCHNERHQKNDRREAEHADRSDDGDLEELFGSTPGVESGTQVLVSGFFAKTFGALFEDDIWIGFAVEDEAYNACRAGLL